MQIPIPTKVGAGPLSKRAAAKRSLLPLLRSVMSARVAQVHGAGVSSPRFCYFISARPVLGQARRGFPTISFSRTNLRRGENRLLRLS